MVRLESDFGFRSEAVRLAPSRTGELAVAGSREKLTMSATSSSAMHCLIADADRPLLKEDALVVFC